MIIESLIRRKGGSIVELGQEVYHFLPNEHEHHVCTVVNETHVKALLAITEGFAPFGARQVSNADRSQKPAAEPVATVADEGDEQAAADVMSLVASDEETASLHELTKEQLTALYEQKFGKKPHWRSGADKLIKDLEADNEGNS